MKSNDEINRKIAEFMGLCGHDLVLGSDDVWRCNEIDCRIEVQNYGGIHGDPKPNPDYCSDDPPRRLLNEAVAKLCETFDYHEWVYFLREVMIADGAILCDCDLCDDEPRLLQATAEQISRAIVACIEAGEEQPK